MVHSRGVSLHQVAQELFDDRRKKEELIQLVPELQELELEKAKQRYMHIRMIAHTVVILLSGISEWMICRLLSNNWSSLHVSWRRLECGKVKECGYIDFICMWYVMLMQVELILRVWKWRCSSEIMAKLQTCCLNRWAHSHKHHIGTDFSVTTTQHCPNIYVYYWACSHCITLV